MYKVHKDLLLDEIAESFQRDCGGVTFSLGRIGAYNALTETVLSLKDVQGRMGPDEMFGLPESDAEFGAEFAFAIQKEAEFYALKALVARDMTPEVRNTYHCMKMKPEGSAEYDVYFNSLVELVEPLLANVYQELGISQERRHDARWFLLRVLNGSRSYHPFFQYESC